jgi:hypothetical protein
VHDETELRSILRDLDDMRARVAALLVDPIGVAPAEPAQQPEPEWLETWEAAERFTVSDDTIRKWCQRHRGVGEKLEGTGRWLVNADAVRERAELMRARDNSGQRA